MINYSLLNNVQRLTAELSELQKSRKQLMELVEKDFQTTEMNADKAELNEIVSFESNYIFLCKSLSIFILSVC